MLGLRMLVLGLGLTLLASVNAQDKKTPFDPAKLVGKWTLIEGYKAGEKIGEDTKKSTITITKDLISLKAEDAEFEFKYKTDPVGDIGKIDLEITKPEAFAGTKAEGIIKLQAGKASLCYHPMGGDRPKTFESNKDNGNYLFVMQAAKKKEKKEKKKKDDK